MDISDAKAEPKDEKEERQYAKKDTEYYIYIL